MVMEKIRIFAKLERCAKTDKAMKKRVKLMIAALLGFSTACSTVKEAPRATEGEMKPEAVERIKLMYGVPSPRPVIIEQGQLNAPDSTRTGEKIYAAPLESPTTQRDDKDATTK